MKNIIFFLSALSITLIFATCKKDSNPGKDDFYYSNYTDANAFWDVYQTLLTG